LINKVYKLEHKISSEGGGGRISKEKTKNRAAALRLPQPSPSPFFKLPLSYSQLSQNFNLNPPLNTINHHHHKTPPLKHHHNNHQTLIYHLQSNPEQQIKTTNQRIKIN
jgi:hypothetical protein